MTERAIFLAVLEIDDADRRLAYLDEACAGDQTLRAQIDGLLKAHEESGDFMDRPAHVADSPPVPSYQGANAEAPGTVIGHYKLLEQIGEGGFGVVFMAEQVHPVRRKVALKVLKPGMDTRQVVARFEAERQALALMDHPNIAHVLDGGETPPSPPSQGGALGGGRPYFVMELVRGIPITDFCDQNHLPVRPRLELFVSVCHAAQHAHQKGIIHRDLKPTNILITLHDGVPVAKVIDFGIAKALGQQLTDKTLFTGFAQMIGTPIYMSPEQAELSGLDMDTRSDIYSLGVLLYELLTGTTPCDKERLKTAAYDEIRRIIREEEPARPSLRVSTLGQAAGVVSAHRACDPRRLGQLMRGELDWIVLKALEKDRNRRYETASAFAEDVQRYLRDEPVQACPPSAAYRLRRLVRRHRGPVLAAALLLLALVSGIIGTTWGLFRATHAQADAVKEAQQKKEALAAALESERDARDKFFLALLNQARAGRFSRQMGQRLDSLDALAKAAAIRSDQQLRDEAIAALALPDIRKAPTGLFVPGGSLAWAFDADYRLYARAGRDGVISVRSMADDQEIRSIAAGFVAHIDLWFSPDGRYLGMVEKEGRLRVWRVVDGETVLREEPRAISTWACSPDSRQLVVAREDWIVRYDLISGEEVNRWQLAQQATVFRLAINPDNRRLAVGYDDSTQVSVFDTTSGKPITELPVGHIDDQTVAWHPDGKRLAVAGSDPRIQIWDVAARRKLATLEGHVQNVTDLSFHPDGDLLVSSSWDGVLRLWDVATGRALMQLPLAVLAVQFSRDGRWLGVAGQAAEARLLEVAPTREYRTIVSSLGAGQGGYNEGGDLSPDGRLLALNMGGDGVRLWDLPRGQELAELPPGLPLFQPNGLELIICNHGGMHRWPIQKTGTGDNELGLGPPRTTALPVVPARIARSQNGRTLAVVSEAEQRGVLVDLATDTVKEPVIAHPQVAYVGLSPNGQWLATGGWHSNQVRLWNAHTRQMVHEWPLSRCMVFFTPDSRVLLISQSDEFSFWDVATLQPILRLRRDVALYPGWVAFAPGGALMALEMAPGIIHLKDVKTGRTVARLNDPHGDRAGWMGFTPDGTQLVVAAPYARAIHVWDLRALRQRLKSITLDWDWPEFPPPPVGKSAEPIKLKVLLERP